MGLKKLSLMSRILLIVTLACGLCAAVSIQGFLHFNQQELERGIVNKERTVHTQLGAATEYVARQGGLPDVIAKFSKKYTSAAQMTDQDKREVLNQVPIYAALSIGKKNAPVDNYQFRVFSDEPRRKENQADAHELEILRRFDRDPALEEIVLNEDGVITMYRPVRLSENQGCLACHGNPANSPWNDGTDILGHRMENWKDGKLHGVFAISQNIAAVAAAANAGHAVTPSAWLIGAIILGALVSLVFSALMVRGTIAALNRITNVLCGATTHVHEASEDIATSSRKLAESSSEQAASLEQTSSSIEEMSSMVRKNSDNAKSTAETSGGSREKAQEGQQVVRRMMESMTEIDRSNQDIMAQVNHSNEQMAGIVKVIEEIGLKTRVINDIVFQTKLLSFNASVEAARAGEHGKGFAVVAEEVGNLAAMSGNAAKEISDMLEESQRKVSAIADSTKTEIEQLISVGKMKVENGAQIARQCGEVLNDILTNVSSVSQMAGEISTASQEQATGVHELTKAMNQLDQATQQNSAIAEKSAHSAQSLAEQASSLRSALKNLVATVRGDGNGDGSEAEQTRRAA